MDLQQYLYEGLKKMFVGKVIEIKTERISDTVVIKEVKFDDNFIILETNKKDTCEIKLSLNTYEFFFSSKHKYSIMFKINKDVWNNHECDESVEITV